MANRRRIHGRLLRFYLHISGQFLRYYCRAQTRYDVRSPFVAEFAEQVVENRRQYYAFSDIEALRGACLRDRRRLRVTDFGAGSQAIGGEVRRVSSLARHAAIHPEAARWLFHLVRHYRPRTILELGASLGISALYLSAPDSRARIWTIEGCPATAALAGRHFEALERSNITLLTGTFREHLPGVLAGIDRLDLLFLDGDHREAASLEYVESCLLKAHPGSIFVLADIHWSPDMHRAWRRLRRHPRVRLSIDLFHLGLLFFHSERRQPEHSTLISARWKPWRKWLATGG